MVEPFKPTNVGALDSDAFRSGRPVGAHLFRTMAGQSNLQHDLPSIMSAVALEATEDPDNGAPYTLATNNEWRLVMPWFCPRRPNWTKATVAMQVRARSGAAVEFGFTFRDEGLSLVQPIELIGDGTIQTLTQSIDLPRGGEVEAPRLWVRGRAAESPADTAVIGTPQTWTGNTVVQQGFLDYSGTQTWDVDELDSGRYEIQAATSGGAIIFRRDINAAYAPPLSGIGQLGWQRGNNSLNPRMLSVDEVQAANASGAQFELLVRDRSVDLYSLMLVGGTL